MKKLVKFKSRSHQSSSVQTPKRSRLPNYHWDQHATQRQCFDEIARKLGVQKQEDWYQVTYDDVRTNGGGGVMKAYGGGLSKTLSHVYPEFTWQVFRFSQVPDKYWRDKKHQREYFDWIAEQLGVEHPYQWKKVSYEQFTSVGKQTSFSFYGSFYATLATLYPEHKWYPWMFDHVPAKYWLEWRNVRLYMDWFADEHNFETMTDWYKVYPQQILDRGGAGLLSLFEQSVLKLVQYSFPEIVWHDWLFSRVPTGYWFDTKNQREYMDWLGEKLGVRSDHDWYKVQLSDVRANAGRGLIEHYRNSMLLTLRGVYPEKQWWPWMFNSCTKGYWNSLHHQRQFIDFVADELNITSQKGLYSIGLTDIQRLGGGGLMNLYSNSIPLVFATLLPEYTWQPWLFPKVVRGYWNDWSNVSEYIKWISQRLNIDDIKDWHTVPSTCIVQLGGSSVLKKGYPAVLQNTFPDHEWHLDAVNFSTKTQIRLHAVLQELFSTSKAATAPPAHTHS